uniref:Uncharacterized protein n=1 Tax=Anguilla anguilla TaxID=7936 RepID=A0A0E9XIT8_ANGAN
MPSRHSSRVTYKMKYILQLHPDKLKRSVQQ